MKYMQLLHSKTVGWAVQVLALLFLWVLASAIVPDTSFQGPLILGATLATTAATLMDWAKRLDPTGKIAKIVEMLEQTNEILNDMLWLEGNLPTGHRTTVRTGLPSVAWRLLNQGVAPSKSTTAQIDEQCGMLEAYGEVDKDLAELNGNTSEFRLSEAVAFVEAMNQEMAGTLFYGNSGTAPEEFTGLAPRYSSTTAGNGQNVISGGGSGSDNSSIWLVVWGQNTVHGIFPKGSQAGIRHTDKGLQTVTTSGTGTFGGNKMEAYLDHWQWKAGIALRDWRYVVRIANIDISAVIADGAGATVKIMEYMLKAIHRIPAMNMGRPVFYMNRTLLEMLDIQAMNKANVYLNVGEEEGRRKVSFRGVPLRGNDQLLETEATVS